MAYAATPEEQARVLRRAESAAASAIGHGCTPDEVRAAVEAGIADEQRLEAQRQGARSGRHAAPTLAPTAPSQTPALDAWEAQLSRY